ncbi:MAG: ComF family protein [Acidobacteriota bacterium]
MGETQEVRLGVIARQLADGLLAILLAPACASCREPLPSPTSGIVCDACWRAARAIAPPFFVPCVDACEAAGVYDGALRGIVHALKYQKRTSLARPLAALIVERCGNVFAGADGIVPVPLHPSRQRQRGFNQAELIARALPLPCANVLERVRATPSQTDLPADKRRENVRGAFAVRAVKWGRSPLLLGMQRKMVTVPISPILIDDVATTGATLSECARVLKEAGARDVRAVTVARAL